MKKQCIQRKTGFHPVVSADAFMMNELGVIAAVSAAAFVCVLSLLVA